MANLFTALGVFAICAILVSMVLLLADDTGAKEQKLMGYFLGGALVQNAGYLLEMTAPTVESALTGIKVQYLGSVFVPLCYCWFTYYYCNSKPVRPFMYFLGTMDLVVLLMVFTQDKHNLFYRNVEWLVAGDGHRYLRLSYGYGYPVFMLCGCLIPYALSIYTLIRAILSTPKYAVSRKYRTILCLSCLPILALLAYVFDLASVYDPTPATLGITLSMVASLIWRRQTYDYRRMATEVLLDSMGDGVVLLDTERRLISFNHAAATVFPDLASAKVGENIESIRDFPQDAVGEQTVIGFNLNEHYYVSHAEEIQDKGKNLGYVLLILDVTDTQNYIEEIKSLREQAEKANIAKSEFLANMSHEIRTPMNAIVGLSDLIMEESVGRKLYNNARDIKSASQNLLAIINDILDLSKVEAGKMELVPTEYYVKNMVDEVVHLMEVAASQHGLVMQHEYDDTIPCRYYGDQGRIKQVLINLLNNAVKFTKEGYVKITLEGRPGENEDEEILIFHVEDTGCGIREEDQEVIFENFKQVDSRRNRSVEGTGLGLSITKQLVQLMGGTIGLKSVYGIGTVFTVTIPQKIVDRRAMSEIPDQPAGQAGKVEPFTAEGVSVLVVDDNLINRKVAGGLLQAYHFDLDEAENGFDAIELVKKKKYDIIFMDHMMPEMDGIETVHYLRGGLCGENGTEPVIIALTANAMEGVRERFLSNGFQDFLPKPLDRQHLNACLLQWIPEERRSAPPPDAAQQPDQTEEDDDVGCDIELLRLYCLDGERKTTLLRELYDKKDYHNYEIEVHALKSASASVGAMSLSAMAKAHEEAARDGNTEFVETHFDELLAAYEDQLQSFQSFIDKKDGKSETAQEALPELDRASLIADIKEALSQLESFHSKECAAKIDELLRHSLEQEVADRLREIRAQLQLYEDEHAEELLGALIDCLDREEN